MIEGMKLGFINSVWPHSVPYTEVVSRTNTTSAWSTDVFSIPSIQSWLGMVYPRNRSLYTDLPYQTSYSYRQYHFHTYLRSHTRIGHTSRVVFNFKRNDQ